MNVYAMNVKGGIDGALRCSDGSWATSSHPSSVISTPSGSYCTYTAQRSAPEKSASIEPERQMQWR